MHWKLQTPQNAPEVMTHNSSSGLLPTSDGEELYFKAVINCQCDPSELREKLCCGSIDVGREQGPASTSFPQTERLLIRETLWTTCLPLGTRWMQAFYLRPRLLCPSPAVDVWESALSPALGKSRPHGIRTGIPSSTQRAHGQAAVACSGIGRDRLAQAATKSLPC